MLCPQASQASIENDEDDEQVDYVMKLREMCMEAYTGIVQSVKELPGQPRPAEGGALAAVHAHVPHMLALLTRLSGEPLTDGCVAAAAGLIGDLLSTFGAAVAAHIDTEPIQKLLQRARRAKTAKARSLSTYATKELRRIKNAATLADG